MDFTAFGFEAKVAFSDAGLAYAIHKFAVDGEFHDPVDGHHVIHIPLSSTVATKLRRHASPAAWILGHDLQTVSAEEFPADVTRMIGLAVFGSV